MKIISSILIVITVYLSFSHGWKGITMNVKPEEAKLFNDIGITGSYVTIMSVLTLLVGVLVLFPQTFFAGNLLNAGIILVIMAMALKNGVIKTAAIELPFLLLPLVLIYLGHPLKK